MAAIVARPPRLVSAQLVQLGVDAVAHDAALAQERRAASSHERRSTSAAREGRVGLLQQRRTSGATQASRAARAAGSA